MAQQVQPQRIRGGPGHPLTDVHVDDGEDLGDGGDGQEEHAVAEQDGRGRPAIAWSRKARTIWGLTRRDVIFSASNNARTIICGQSGRRYVCNKVQ